MKKPYRIALAAITSSTFLFGVSSALSGQAGSTGIVASIDKAPVIADGDVRGQPTDYVITLEGSLDPNVPGRSLAEGKVIKIIFPGDFDLGNLDSNFPLADLPKPFPPPPASPLPPKPCLPGNLQCTTAVILPGWPQDPLFPPILFHTLSIDPVGNALLYTAAQNIGPVIKQLHLILNGVLNPKPGNYRIRVEAQTGPGGAWETGSGLLQVLPKARPSINITSVFVKALSGQLGDPACIPGTNPPNPDNPIYQTTTVGTDAPFVWTFLLWGKNNQPLTNLWLNEVNPNHIQLKHGNKTVGQIFIDAPQGADGYGITLNPLSCPTLLPAAPVIGGTPGIGPQPVGRLDLLFTAGDTSGVYATTLSLNNGNTVQMFVTAE